MNHILNILLIIMLLPGKEMKSMELRFCCLASDGVTNTDPATSHYNSWIVELCPLIKLNDDVRLQLHSLVDHVVTWLRYVANESKLK